MKQIQWLMRINKPLLFLISVGIGVFSWLGWSYYDRRYPSWYEEVQLSDGRVITVHQKREYFDNYGTNQSWVTIDLPELGGRQIWHSYLMPMRVDVIDGVVFVVGRPRGPKQMAFYGYPKMHLVAFRWSDGVLSRIPLSSVPTSILSEENIYSCLFRAKSDLLSHEAKLKNWCPPSGERGQFAKKIDMGEYKRHADAMAALANWKNRSE
ncbi:MAG: hypothetical protein KF871_11750 [Hydrogenophaga sp.]|uniref:hypothetical protein n=1 Tax=Hydrogenophaga sp. TaxID=1904254 RepID=UPI001E0C2C24|nr:hypothetical protein [Hydrogenophaga sp.]MBX3610559.1 hypothetical protein [Hydrogenophaga sp.]